MEELVEILKTIIGMQKEDTVVPITGNLKSKQLIAKQDDILFYMYFKDNIPAVEVYEYKETRIGTVEG